MKQDLYEQLVERKNKGEKIEWNNITQSELKELFREHPDSMIAELYDVSISKVKKQRNEWNIKRYHYAIEEAVQNFFNVDTNKTLYENLNKNSKERLFDKNNIDTISIALTQYLFRSGPVENIHAAGKLSQDDMKTLNKFMVNRIAGLLETMHEGKWLNLELLFNFYSLFGKDWDKPIPDTTEIDAVQKNKF